VDNSRGVGLADVVHHHRARRLRRGAVIPFTAINTRYVSSKRPSTNVLSIVELLH
jgi:hypothetical protein